MAGEAAKEPKTAHRSLRLGLLVSGALLAIRPGIALEFYPAVPFELSGTDPTDVTVADFNGDGVADLAFAMAGVSSGDGKIAVMQGDGAGGLTDHPFPVHFRPWGIASADFNLDGRPDLAVTEGNSESRAVSLFTASGDGFVIATEANSGGTFPIALGAGDLNEDGKTDLVVGNAQLPGLSVLPGHGTGTFGPAQNPPDAIDTRGRDVVLADLDRDGHLDVLTPQGLLLGDGRGGLVWSHGFGGSLAVAVGEFNGDGLPDVASLGRDFVQIWLGQQDVAGYSLAIANNSTIAGDAQALAAVDLDGDGRSELAITARSPDALLLFSASSEGVLTPFPAVAVGPEPGPVASADWNGDGYPDLAVACRNRGETPQVALLLQKPGGSAARGRLRFSRSEYRIGEAAAEAALSIARVDGDTGELAAQWFTVAHTAAADEDFVPSSGQLLWMHGETGSKPIVVTLRDDSAPEAVEWFEVQLSAPESTAARVTIEDDDSDLPPGEPAPEAPSVPPPLDTDSRTGGGGGGGGATGGSWLVAAVLALLLRRRFTAADK